MQRKRKRVNPKAEAEAEEDQSSKHFIPDDVIKDILILSPARLLFRLRYLSKKWFCFLSCPEFTSSHAVRTQSKAATTTELVSFFPETKSFHTLNLERGLRNNIYSNAANKISLPWKPNIRCSPIGSCNGLICLIQPYKSIHEIYFLINPMTREFTKIKYFRDGSDKLKPKPEYQYGFGYDLSTQDYKIVRISSYGYAMSSYRVAVFSLKSRCWTSIEEDNDAPPSPYFFPPFPYFFPIQMAAHVNGVLHWRCRRLPGNNIFTFDLATNKCGVLSNIPGGSDYNNIVSVSVFQGCLCVTRATSDELFNIGYSIWMMKEYGVEESWTKFISINVGSGLHQELLSPRPICYANKRKSRLLLLQDENNQVSLYKIEDGSLRICKVPANFSYNRTVVEYTESLVSPKLL